MPQWLVDLAQVVGGIGTLIALVALWVAWRQLRQGAAQLSEQLRHSTDLTKAANAQQLTAHAAAFNAILYQDKDISRLWYSYGDNLDVMDTNLYREMIIQWLIFHENTYYQYKKDLLDNDLYMSW